MTKPKFQLSQIDTDHFGIRVLQVNISFIKCLDVMSSFCHENDIQLLIMRVNTHHLDLVQNMENRWFSLNGYAGLLCL